MQIPKVELKYIIREAAFFFLYFFYIWLVLNPALYNQYHDPVFQIGYDFFKDFLRYPGGLTEYIAALISQLFYLPVMGALVVTFFAWTASSLTAALIRVLQPDLPVRMIHFLPAILLLILHSHYKYSLSVTLAFVSSLVFILLQFRAVNKGPWRFLSYLSLGMILYYLAGGSFFIFAICCVLYEALWRRNSTLAALYLAIAAAIPYLGRSLFPINTRMAFFTLLPMRDFYGPLIIRYSLLIVSPLLVLAYHPYAFRKIVLLQRLRLKKPWLQFSVQTLVMLAITVGAAGLSYDKDSHLLLQVDYYARHEQWAKLLHFSRQNPSNLLPVTFQTNRALFHTGQLLEDMFSFPQENSTAGLLLPRRYSESAPLQESDFCYDLGAINESRHWAYEAVSTDGENAWIVKRMALVNFVSGDFKAASRCLNVLDKMLLFRGWSKRLRGYLDDPSLAANDETIAHGCSMLVKNDFVVVNGHPPSELDSLLEVNPKNRMALEYRIAHELLSCRLKGLMQHVEMLRNFDYPHIPRHVEEALIGLWAMNRKQELPPIFRFVRKETLQSFADFNRILSKYQGNRSAARDELQQAFGDTYWFYAVYNNPVRRMAEQAAAQKGGLE